MVTSSLHGLTVNHDVCRKAAQGGYANATELADYLVSKGVPFRQAHHNVGELVQQAIQAQNRWKICRWGRFRRLFRLLSRMFMSG